MNILSFLNQHKRIIAGIVILIVLIVTISILLKPNSNQWINCHQNQTLQTCDGKQVCIDNCKDGTKKCNPCDKTCCPNDSSCLGKPPNSVCCSANNICTNSTTEKQTCCTESQFCDQDGCIDCPEGKTLCKNSQGVNTHCCDTDKEECCGDDGVCCPKGNCMKDAQGEKICCDSNDSVVVDGQCCLQSQLYMKDDKLACCSNGKVCYDGKKATCCDENEKCSDPGYCVLNTTNPTILNKCIVNAETETEDVIPGQFCVNKDPYQFGNSSFKDCSSKCDVNEICKTLYYRKKYNCTSPDNCNGLGQSGITSTCYTSKYDATNKIITYTKVTNCDENNKDQVQGGSCGIPCGNGSPGKAPLFCPKTDSCNELKIDGKTTSYVCGNTTPKFGAQDQTPSKVQINEEPVNACDQYYPLPTDTKKCILYDNEHGKQISTDPLVHPNGNSYCPLYTKNASALHDPNKNPLQHGPVIITSTGYSGYGGEANFPVVQDKKTGPYNVNGQRVEFGPKDTPLKNLEPIAYSTTTTTDTANAADCYKQFDQTKGVQYITWEPNVDANGKSIVGGTCRAYYDCNNIDFMDAKNTIWNKIKGTYQQIPTGVNSEDKWYGTICPDNGTNDYIKISDNEGQVGSLATCTVSTKVKK
jgi:hypothetical protein